MEDIPCGGLAFWASDPKNYYEAAIVPNGTFGVFRLVNDEWATVVPRTMSDTIKKGIGAVNELQVVLNNSNGWLYINGVRVQEFAASRRKTEARSESSHSLKVTSRASGDSSILRSLKTNEPKRRSVTAA